jgi:hypothetical protein
MRKRNPSRSTDYVVVSMLHYFAIHGGGIARTGIRMNRIIVVSRVERWKRIPELILQA